MRKFDSLVVVINSDVGYLLVGIKWKETFPNYLFSQSFLTSNKYKRSSSNQARLNPQPITTTQTVLMLSFFKIIISRFMCIHIKALKTIFFIISQCLYKIGLFVVIN